MAVAALVLGILTFVCLGPIAGVLAIIFGFLGLSKAKELGSGRGMSIAGIVLGAVGTIVSIVVLLVIVFAADDVADNVSESIQDAFGPVDSSDYELTTESCEIDRFGSVTFTGTIENTSDRDLDVNVIGEIRNADTDVLLETPSDYVSMPEGDTVQWSLDTYIDDPVDITCEVTDVNNWFNN